MFILELEWITRNLLAEWFYWGKWLSCSYVNSQTTRKWCGTKSSQYLRYIRCCRYGGLLSLAGCIWECYLSIILLNFCLNFPSSGEKLCFPLSSSPQLEISSIPIYVCQHSTFLLTELFFNIDHCLLPLGSCSSKEPQYSCVFDSLDLILNSAKPIQGQTLDLFESSDYLSQVLWVMCSCGWPVC